MNRNGGFRDCKRTQLRVTELRPRHSWMMVVDEHYLMDEQTLKV